MERLLVAWYIPMTNKRPLIANDVIHTKSIVPLPSAKKGAKKMINKNPETNKQL